jgi:hypothetical protein
MGWPRFLLPIISQKMLILQSDYYDRGSPRLKWIGFVFLLTEPMVNKKYIQSNSHRNLDKFPIRRGLVPPGVYDHRMLYEHHIGSDVDIAYNRK